MTCPSILGISTLRKSAMIVLSVLIKIRYRSHEILLRITSGEKEQVGCSAQFVLPISFIQVPPQKVGLSETGLSEIGSALKVSNIPTLRKCIVNAVQL